MFTAHWSGVDELGNEGREGLAQGRGEKGG